MQQYFLGQKIEVGQKVDLDQETTHHLIKVLRARNGEVFRLIDSKGRVYLAELQAEKKKVQARIIEEIIEKRESPMDIHLGLARIKKDKWEWALQKTTELGVKKIFPLITERTVVREFHNEEKTQKRFEKIIQEAAEQSERHLIPSLEPEIHIKDLQVSPQAIKLFCWERTEETSPNLLTFLEEGDWSSYESAFILVGPEGGFSQEEGAFLIDQNFQPLSLGPRILRAETAAMLSVGLLAQYFEAEY